MRNILAATALAGMTIAAPVYAQDAAYDASTVLATVDGTDITLGHLISIRGSLPQQYQSVPDEQLFPGLLDQLIDQTVLAKAQSDSPENDPLSVRLVLENERRSLLAAAGTQDLASGPVDDAETQAEYETAIADFQPQPEYNAAHILVEDEARSKELLAEITGGADFAEVAAANSIDGSAAGGGDLGWFGPGQMVPEFEAAVVGAEPGEVVGPVQTQFGFHLVKLNEKRESSPPTLEEVRPQVEQKIRQDRLRARLDELKTGLNIERVDVEIPFSALSETNLLTASE